MTPAKLRALIEAGTPGPWRRFYEGDTVAVLWRGKTDIVKWAGFDDSDRPVREHAANAAAIVALHNLAPKLLALWEAAQAWAEFIEGPSNPNYLDHAEEHANRWETLTRALNALEANE